MVLGLAAGSGAAAGVFQGRVIAEAGFRPQPPSWAPPSEDYCGVRAGQREALLIGGAGGIANCVVVFPNLKESAELPALSEDKVPLLDNRGCEFQPHVLLAIKGREVRLRNSDPVFHNVNAHTVEGHYGRFNYGLPAAAPGVPDQPWRPRRAGALVLRCDAGHTWMKGFLYVAPSRFVGLTDAKGKFRIPGVPAGRHTVRLWHESYGRADATIQVGIEDEVTSQDFVAWFDSAAAFVPIPGTGLVPVRAANHRSPTSKSVPAPSRHRVRPEEPLLPPGRPLWLAVLWVLGVVEAGGMLLVLRRRRLEASPSLKVGDDVASS